VSAQGEPGPGDARSVRLRWIARAVVVAVVLVVAFAVLGLRYLAPRRRAG
jgi:hypothetical protein